MLAVLWPDPAASRAHILTLSQQTNKQYGSGGVFWMGAGILTLIANPQYASYLVYYQVGAGSDTFLGGACICLYVCRTARGLRVSRATV